MQQETETHRTEENSQQEFDPKQALESLRGSGMKQKVIDHFEKMKRLEEQRASINDELKAERSKMQAEGIPKEAIAIAYKLYKMDLDKVQSNVIGVALCMDAAELPVQIDFLDNVTKLH
jgi:uncharacterized protein (UPF0335 family)